MRLPLFQTGEYWNHQQFCKQREDLQDWLQQCCRSVLQAARNRSELPRGWEIHDDLEIDWPSFPLSTPNDLCVWLESRLQRFFELRDTTSDQTTCLRIGQRDLRNARRTLVKLNRDVPEYLMQEPLSTFDVESCLTQLVEHLSRVTTSTSAESTLPEKNIAPEDQTNGTIQVSMNATSNLVWQGSRAANRLS